MSYRSSILVVVLCANLLSFIVTPCAAGDPAPPLLPIRQELELTYGKGAGEDLKLDLFAPQKPAGLCPAVILLHGGGWSRGSKNELRGAAAYFAQRGYVAVTVEYRLAPKYHFPAQLEDAKCAVRWLRANGEKYHIDPDRIGAMGGSAGAHLALLVGFVDEKAGFEGTGGDAGFSSRVEAVVNWMGPTDFVSDDWPPLTEKLIEDFIGSDRSKGPDAFVQASPLHYIHKDAPPVLTAHGTRDNVVPFDQAKRLDAALRSAGVESQFETLEGKGHGDGLTADDVVRLLILSVDFLDKHLKAK